jgi:hypothetical protein
VKDSLFLGVCRTGYLAVFQMMGKAMAMCPDEIWGERTDEPAFWQQAYHALMYTDFYLEALPRAYKKPDFAEEKANDLAFLPTVVPPKEQMQSYLRQVSGKCGTVLDSLTSEQLEGANAFTWTGPTVAHRLVYNIRHAQHHVGRLNSLLARRTGKSAEWVIAAESV